MTSSLSGKSLGRVKSAINHALLADTSRPTYKGVYTVEPADKALAFMPMHA